MIIRESRWMDLDRQFLELQGDLDLDNYLAPVNRSSELAKFLEMAAENQLYNPTFEYDPLPRMPIEALKKFQQSLKSDDPVEAIFHEAVTCRLGEIQAATDHDGGFITDLTTAMYGKPDPELLDYAQENLRALKPDQRAYVGDLDGKIYNAEELAELCREAMKGYGFDWKIVVKPEMGAKAAVDNLIREFWIRGDVKFHESLVKMIIVHEIGTHVLRSENGYAQPLKIFGRGLPAYQFTEEGLAEYAEEQCGVLMEDTLYRISGRVIGVNTAISGSFWDVYLAVKDHFDPEMAFDIAQRAKLGQRNTSQPGSYTKDYTYLAGLRKIRVFFENPGRREIDAMFAGKVGFQHLETVTHLQKTGYLNPPKSYPEWWKQPG